MITLLLVDDHAYFRRTLRQFLDAAPDLRVLGEAGDGDEAVAMARSLQPDVVLMDIQMPRRDGVLACRTIKAASGVPKVILYSAYESELYRARESSAGADLLLAKQHLFEQVRQALQTVAARNTSNYQLPSGDQP